MLGFALLTPTYASGGPAALMLGFALLTPAVMARAPPGTMEVGHVGRFRPT